MRETLGEVLLLSFGMLILTLSWSAIMSFLEPVTTDGWWASLVTSVILFLMLYPPSRLVFFIEEWLVKQSLFEPGDRALDLCCYPVCSTPRSSWLIELNAPDL